MFAERNLDMTKTAMMWGLDCGDGWFDLIWETCEKLKPMVSDDFRFSQVKEKYGGLRMYWNDNSKAFRPPGHWDKISKIISKAEEKSETICELCGKPSTIRRTESDWLYNCCNECWGISKLIE